MNIYPTLEEMKIYIDWSINKYLQFAHSTGKFMTPLFIKQKLAETKLKLFQSSLKIAKINNQSKIASFFKALPNLRTYVKNERLLEEYQLFEVLNGICEVKNLSDSKELTPKVVKDVNYKELHKQICPEGYEMCYICPEIHDGSKIK